MRHSLLLLALLSGLEASGKSSTLLTVKDGRILPGFAKEYRSTGRNEYRFQLEKGLADVNGREFRPKDFVECLERYMGFRIGLTGESSGPNAFTVRFLGDEGVFLSAMSAIDIPFYCQGSGKPSKRAAAPAPKQKRKPVAATDESHLRNRVPTVIDSRSGKARYVGGGISNVEVFYHEAPAGNPCSPALTVLEASIVDGRGFHLPDDAAFLLRSPGVEPFLVADSPDTLISLFWQDPEIQGADCFLSTNRLMVQIPKACAYPQSTAADSCIRLGRLVSEKWYANRPPIGSAQYLIEGNASGLVRIDSRGGDRTFAGTLDLTFGYTRGNGSRHYPKGLIVRSAAGKVEILPK